MTRPDGFYWVRNEGGRPEIAEWDKDANLWFTTKCGQVYDSQIEVLPLYGSQELPIPLHHLK